ncbi:NYN domain-containing protein [bacterium]|nr:MAG: NYN domain-containing protein [bacterium]
MCTKTSENNYAFIDSQNLNLAVQDQGWKLHWEKFRVYLKDKYGVTKAFLFIGYVPTNQALYTSLQQKGYIVTFKPTLTLPTGKPKGNTDAELVLHAMIEYPNYDKAVIIGGDGDYYCLVEHLKKQNKLKKLIIPNRAEYSSLLRKFLPDMAFVSDLRGKLEYI